MGDNWYAKYPGDYRRDTSHLTVTQHGAYNLLMDCYYATGKPLPAEIPALVRMVGCQDRKEREAVATVAEEFFPVGGDGLRHNRRCDREIEKRDEFLAEQTRKAKLGGQARWHARGDAPGKPAGIFRGCPDDAPPPPPPQPQEQPHAPPTPTESASGFSDFWHIYPRKVGKEAALRAWISAVANGDAAAIMAALSWQVELAEWKRDGGRFVPKPATYLFDRRRTDERLRDPFLDDVEDER